MGCCTPISCSMDTACDEEESKDLFSEAGLEYPTACSRNAFKTKLGFKLSGVTLAQAKAKKTFIQKDVAASLALDTSAVTISLKEASRRAMRALGSAVQVDAVATTPTREDGDQVKDLAGEIELVATEKEFGAEGVEAQIDGAASVQTTTSNAEADGEVVDESFDASEDPDQLNGGSQASALGAVTLGVLATTIMGLLY